MCQWEGDDENETTAKTPIISHSEHYFFNLYFIVLPPVSSPYLFPFFARGPIDRRLPKEPTMGSRGREKIMLRAVDVLLREPGILFWGLWEIIKQKFSVISIKEQKRVA